MGNLSEIISVACDECNGAGFLFWGDNDTYDVMQCDCVNDGSLFWNGENN